MNITELTFMPNTAKKDEMCRQKNGKDEKSLNYKLNTSEDMLPLSIYGKEKAFQENMTEYFE
jgi:hypothetical protein